FDRRALVAAKRLINEVSLPPFDRLLDAFTSFGKALGGPEAQNRIRTVLERGLQRDAGFEKNWPEVLGTLVESGRKGGRDDSHNWGRAIKPDLGPPIRQSIST